jgi:hypothetical protein
MVAALGIPAAIATGLNVAGKVLEVAQPIIDRFFPDPQKALEMRVELIRALQASDLGQLEVNREEARHPSLFVAGWRPFIGWVLGIGVGYAFLLAPVATGVARIWWPEFRMPAPEQNMWELVFAMLGMGALRSFEKYQGVGTIQVGGTSPSVGLGQAVERAR